MTSLTGKEWEKYHRLLELGHSPKDAKWLAKKKDEKAFMTRKVKNPFLSQIAELKDHEGNIYPVYKIFFYPGMKNNILAIAISPIIENSDFKIIVFTNDFYDFQNLNVRDVDSLAIVPIEKIVDYLPSGWKIKRLKQKDIPKAIEKYKDILNQQLFSYKGNPMKRKKLSRPLQKKASMKIAKLIREGYEPDQAAAIAYQMARAHKIGPRGGRKRNPIFNLNPRQFGNLDPDLSILVTIMYLEVHPEKFSSIPWQLRDLLIEKKLFDQKDGRITEAGREILRKARI